MNTTLLKTIARNINLHVSKAHHPRIKVLLVAGKNSQQRLHVPVLMSLKPPRYAIGSFSERSMFTVKIIGSGLESRNNCIRNWFLGGDEGLGGEHAGGVGDLFEGDGDSGNGGCTQCTA